MEVHLCYLFKIKAVTRNLCAKNPDVQSNDTAADFAIGSEDRDQAGIFHSTSSWVWVSDPTGFFCCSTLS